MLTQKVMSILCWWRRRRIIPLRREKLLRMTLTHTCLTYGKSSLTESVIQTSTRITRMIKLPPRVRSKRHRLRNHQQTLIYNICSRSLCIGLEINLARRRTR
uniref:Uncharacterized protein n=1 Tax=Cacopsylla melanoneura TaxID=428564 RepID=A0A8D8ZXD0_9HEMI